MEARSSSFGVERSAGTAGLGEGTKEEERKKNGRKRDKEPSYNKTIPPQTILIEVSRPTKDLMFRNPARPQLSPEPHAPVSWFPNS
jgi:hypothetical protein